MAYLWGMEMTHDEVEAMPAGRYMDALIAERVMGLTNIRPGWADRCGYGGTTIYEHGDKPDYIESEKLAPCLLFGDESSETELPGYSDDIAAAWQVIGHFEAGNAEIHLTKWVDNAPNWLAGIEGFAAGVSAAAWACADTAPLAICRAALLTTLVAEDD